MNTTLTKKEREQAGIREPPPQDLNERWNDHLEATRFATRVFSKLEAITEDFVLADLTEQQKLFITEEMKLAFLARRVMPDKEAGTRIFATITTEAILTAVLNRNLASNTILNIIGNINKEQAIPPEPQQLTSPIEETKESTADRLKGLIKKKKTQ